MTDTIDYDPSVMRKPKRFSHPKDGELKMQYCKYDGDYDMVYSRGEGCSSCDGHLLHYFIGSPKMTRDWNNDGEIIFEKSLLQELDDRGYDISTFKFSIMKKENHLTRNSK